MENRAEAQPGLLVRLLRFPPVLLAVLYVVLTYLYLAGFYFRTGFTDDPVARAAASVMSAALMLAIYASLVGFSERRSVGELALAPMLRETGLGLLLGFGLYSLCVLILIAMGVYRVEGLNPWSILLPGIAAPLATGVFEELVFRGGVFRLAEKWFGTWIALAISSVAFGFVHLENDAATMQGILSISTWAGLLLGATYILTGRLWLGIGLHAAWNYTQGSVYSGIVSGNATPSTGLIRSSMQGPDWLTGGAFGIEASVVALLVCTAVGVAMLMVAARRGKIQPPPWRRAA